ncbi:type II secretion system protein [Bacillus tuaregi]|uniref:type II secretion system protein n=1 Tax=Bacillus tuaregi TaxID=1816695 RepID=UPI0008F85074|nr:type II secretion system protein [Bacillus tuaregi]
MLKFTQLRQVLVYYLGSRKGNLNGFTLVEVLAVIVILGIHAAVAVISVGGIIEKAEKDVCDASVVEIERQYEVYLELESVERPELYLAEFLLSYDGRVCPAGGELRYFDGRVECSVHSVVEEENSDENEDPGVPYL